MVTFNVYLEVNIFLLPPNFKPILGAYPQGEPFWRKLIIEIVSTKQTIDWGKDYPEAVSFSSK
jgi:hypothetical protein